MRARANSAHHSGDLRVRDQYVRVTQRIELSSTVMCSRMCRTWPASVSSFIDERTACWP
ncbi:hypothetical protein [Streptomyces sp. NPDC057413]|uniref:hypothetical protein n=1 Tax=Streptomyces sp. NPDC057413 TaxID=3346124 RepID=UPI00367D83FB